MLPDCFLSIMVKAKAKTCVGAVLTDAIATIDRGKLPDLIAIQTGTSFANFSRNLYKSAARDVGIWIERNFDVSEI